MFKRYIVSKAVIFNLKLVTKKNNLNYKEIKNNTN